MSCLVVAVIPLFLVGSPASSPKPPAAISGTEGAILKQKVLKAVANQLSQATVSISGPVH